MRDLREIMREEMLMRDRVLAVLGGGPKTVPEIAAALGYPSEEVMLWVMGMRKYGVVAEAEEEDGYFKYQAAAAGGGD